MQCDNIFIVVGCNVFVLVLDGLGLLLCLLSLVLFFMRLRSVAAYVLVFRQLILIDPEALFDGNLLLFFVGVTSRRSFSAAGGVGAGRAPHKDHTALIHP